MNPSAGDHAIPVVDLFGDQFAWPACPVCGAPEERHDAVRHRLCDRCLDAYGPAPTCDRCGRSLGRNGARIIRCKQCRAADRRQPQQQGPA